jgi:hypothetical protein
MLLCGAFVAGPGSGIAVAAKVGSFSFSVKRAGTIDRATGLVTLTVTYVCTIPDGFSYDQSEIQVPVVGAGGRIDTNIDIIDGLSCDGQHHNITGTEFNSELKAAGRARYTAAGFVLWTDANGDFGQADYFINGSVILRPIRGAAHPPMAPLCVNGRSRPPGGCAGAWSASTSVVRWGAPR